MLVRRDCFQDLMPWICKTSETKGQRGARCKTYVLHGTGSLHENKDHCSPNCRRSNTVIRQREQLSEMNLLKQHGEEKKERGQEVIA